jgi:hypothetical protein
MYRYIARANIDHYLDLLSDVDLAPETRAVVTKLLTREEDKLGGLEQLEFAESRAAKCRDRLDHLQKTLEVSEGADCAQLERVVANLEAIQHSLDSFCQRLRGIHL